MHLVIIQEKHFGPLEGYENHECEWTIEEENGESVVIWTCKKCPGFIIKSYSNPNKPGVYWSGTKDKDLAAKIHHYGKCDPKFN